MASAPRRPDPHDAVVLVGGPFAGQRFNVKRGFSLALTTRRRRTPGDRPPTATYTGDTASGRLHYTGTYGLAHDPHGPERIGSILKRVLRALVAREPASAEPVTPMSEKELQERKATLRRQATVLTKSKLAEKGVRQ